SGYARAISSGNAMADVANVFWSMCISVGAVQGLIEMPGWMSPDAWATAPYFIVPYESQGNLRHNLLVFLPNLPTSPITVPVRWSGEMPIESVLRGMLMAERHKVFA